jgi:EAL domain-containing protein (putative c-di-GMP-specific phosphodiesterase class I)
MVDYNVFPLNEELKREIMGLNIDYVFQPIFYPDGKSVYAREALMRPGARGVLDLIGEYRNAGRLHVLEVATVFGAVKAFNDRGYQELVSLNSFPSEGLNQDEEDIFNSFYGSLVGKALVEVIEYTQLDFDKWRDKKEILKKKSLDIALDNFGISKNDMVAVDVFQPSVVKIDRSIITGIQDDVEKEESFFYLSENMHRRGTMVLAEGVETKEEFNFLVKHGVDLLQGFYLARPE